MVGSRKRRVVPWLWYISLLLFSYVCGIHACVYLHVCTHACGGLRLMFRISFHWFYLIYWGRVFQSNPELTIVASSVTRKPPFLPFQAGIVGGAPCSPSIYLGSGDLNSSPHVFTSSALSTELSPQFPLWPFLLISLPKHRYNAYK